MREWIFNWIAWYVETGVGEFQTPVADSLLEFCLNRNHWDSEYQLLSCKLSSAVSSQSLHGQTDRCDRADGPRWSEAKCWGRSVLSWAPAFGSTVRPPALLLLPRDNSNRMQGVLRPHLQFTVSSPSKPAPGCGLPMLCGEVTQFSPQSYSLVKQSITVASGHSAQHLSVSWLFESSVDLL